MERVPGRQLCDVWDTMSEVERFGLVKSMVEIEKQLTTAKLSNCGSIYYRNDYSGGVPLAESAILQHPSNKGSKDVSRFIIGPVTQNSFWADGKHDLNIHRGPCRCSLYCCPCLSPA
jgi:hypothetical protein